MGNEGVAGEGSKEGGTLSLSRPTFSEVVVEVVVWVKDMIDSLARGYANL